MQRMFLEANIKIKKKTMKNIREHYLAILKDF